MKSKSLLCALIIFGTGADFAGTPPWRACVVDDGGRYFRETVMTPAKTPVEFTYGGVRHVGFGKCKVLAREIATKGVETLGKLRAQVDANLVVELDGAYRADFGETEWVLRFENPGKAPSKVLSDIVSMRYEFEKCSEDWSCPRLRGIRGDHENNYCPYEVDAWNKPNGFSITGQSRPTHVEFPYFDFYLREDRSVRRSDPTGVLCAIGWAGNWKADFLNVRDRPRPEWQYHIKFRACPDFASVLLPGEKIRNATVVLLPHRGSDPDHVSNLWRAWFRKYNEPKWNAAGEPLRPFSTTSYAADTGKVNSDGSISEDHATWKPTFEKIVAERVVPDFRWYDAGWYFDPRGETLASAWYDVGSLELDTVKWPGHTFRDSVDAGHAVGMKTLMWFEPERACDPEALATNYGYRVEWALPYSKDGLGSDRGTVAWNNIGDPACFKWTLGRILKVLDGNRVDLYREDHNRAPGAAWGEGDRRAETKLKLPRRGMTETKGVMGHWALWDAIIERGRRQNTCTFVDSCASGGGRNDLESLRRAFPLSRSDSDRGSTGLRLSMTSSLCRWIPFHGCCTQEASGWVDPNAKAGLSPFDFRATLLPVLNYGAQYTHNKEADFDILRRNLAEWKSVRDLLLKDFYALTSWHPGDDTGCWTAFAYDDAEKGESVLLAFRQENAPYPMFEARLKFADPKSAYEITDADSGKVTRHSGAELRDKGLLLSLPQRKTSLLLRLKRLPADTKAVAAPIQYWTPAGTNSWVGDVTTIRFKDRLHIFYLYDERHHQSCGGRGGHLFKHLSSADLKTWEEHPIAVGRDEPWEWIGTGTPLAMGDKLYLFYGLHSHRNGPGWEKKFPKGGSYAVSTDGIHFTKSHDIFTDDENPSPFWMDDGRLGIIHSFFSKDRGLFAADRLSGPWLPVDDRIPTEGDCPCPFTWNGWHYVIQGFVTMAASPTGRPGTYEDWVLSGDDVYGGLSVPMVAEWKDNRRLLIGWINGLDRYNEVPKEAWLLQVWGGWLCFRELIQFPDGRLGTKWLAETPNRGETRVYDCAPDRPFEKTFRNEKGQTVVFRVDPKAARAEFSEGGAPRKTLAEVARALDPAKGRRIRQISGGALNAPYTAQNYAIGKIRGLDRPFKVRLNVYYDPKADGTIFDAEIAGTRTMVSRASGRYAD